MGRVRSGWGPVVLVLTVVAGSAYAVPPRRTGKPSQCPAGQSACLRADGAKGACGDHQSDRAKCGACGVMCRQGQSCVSGQCQAPNSCPAGQSACLRADGAEGPCSTLIRLIAPTAAPAA
jgi:hypothetical protein